MVRACLKFFSGSNLLWFSFMVCCGFEPLRKVGNSWLANRPSMLYEKEIHFLSIYVTTYLCKYLITQASKPNEVLINVYGRY
jgi:hypothetical protein